MKDEGNESVSIISDQSTKFNLSKGGLPNFNDNIHKEIGITPIPRNFTSDSKVDKENYIHPIKLDRPRNIDISGIRLYKLEVDNNDSSYRRHKIIPLIDSGIHNQSDRYVTLDVDEKTGNSYVSELTVDKITKKEKLVNLDVEKLLDKTSKIIGLTENKSNNKIYDKIILLSVDDRYKSGKIEELNVESIDYEGKVVSLNTSTSNREATSLIVDLPSYQNTLSSYSKIVTLEVNEKTGDSKVVNLSIDKVNASSKLVNLIINPITKESKIVNLDVDSTDDNNNEVIRLNSSVTSKYPDSKIVNLDEGYIRKSKVDSTIIEINKDDKNLEDKKLVKLQINPKNGNLVLTKLDIPDNSYPSVKTISLPSDTSEYNEENNKIIGIHVPTINGESKIVYLSINTITYEPKIINLSIDKKEVDNSKVVSVPNSEEYSADSKIIGIPNYNSVNEDKPKSLSVIPGTEIPIHIKSSGSIVESYRSNYEVTKLDSNDVSRYSKTAEWMKIPGKIGIQAAKDYEKIIDIYNKIDYQLGGGNEAIDKIKSYITSSVDGGNAGIKIPSHSMKAGNLLEGGAIMRLANAGIRSALNGAGSGVMKSLNLALASYSLLTGSGSISDIINSISGSKGEAKALAIHNALVAVNNLYDKILTKTKTDPGRLPGSKGAFSDAISSLAQGDIKEAAKDTLSGVMSVLGVTDSDTPLNSPSNSMSGHWDDPDKYYESMSDPGDNSDGLLGFLKRAGSSGSVYTRKDGRKYVFKDSLTNPGTKATLKYLVGVDPSEIDSLSTLRDKLNSDSGSSIITNYKRHISAYPFKNDKKIGAIGLDSNHIWEMTLEPFVDDINGNFTYLPSIEYMNSVNNDTYGVRTGYGRWIPFTGFELQSRKMTNKSLSLFDGDISYPISLEFTNELRVTLADDSLKTFRRYFDMISDISVYKSSKYDNSEGNTNPSIDKSIMEVSMYKNVTFLCTIYVMTTGFTTLKRFPLLVVLRDYQVEYSGDTDSGPTELALHFSIVGEISSDDLLEPYVKSGTSSSKSSSSSSTESSKSTVNNSTTSLSSSDSSPSTKVSVKTTDNSQGVSSVSSSTTI